MGKVAKGCAGAIVGLLLLVGIIFWATSGVTGAADEFVEHLAQGQHDEAYAMFGNKVTGELTREDFESFLAGTKLGQAQSASWGSRSFKNNTGEVSGDIKLKDGGTKAVTIYLEKVDGEWLIQGIEFTDPSEDQKEVEEYKAAADEFFGHISQGEIEQAYALCGDLVHKDIDLAGLKSMLEKSLLTTTEKVDWGSHKATNLGNRLEGVATLQDGKKVDVTLTLQELDGKWLVQGINYKHQSGGKVAKPSNEECVTWTKSYLGALATYMDQKDPKPLAQLCHSSLAAKFENGKALEGFLAGFPNHAALRGLLDQPFVFTKAPSQADERSLKIEGRSEVSSDGLYLIFDLDYGVEGTDWKLVNMNLKTRLASKDQPAPAAEL